MPFPDALARALEMQCGVVEDLPPSMLTSDSQCQGWSIRDVLNHSVAVTTKFTDFAAGRTDTPRTPRGDLLGVDYRRSVAAVAEAARTSWRRADMTRSCQLPFGTFSAEIAAGINLFDALAHTWDIAAAVGIALDETAPSWEIGLEAARTVVEDDGRRDREHYGAPTDVPPGAPPMHRFLGYLGRSV